MKTEPRGRIHQDSKFIFSEFNNLRIERLIVCRQIETSEPILIFIKVIGKNWHQYFLDAGMGFWEDWDKIDLKDEEEDEDFTLVDDTNTFRLKNKTISKIFGEEDSNNSRITIEMEDKSQLILKCINPEIFDSECELILVS